jgi:hypothetical protein
MARKFIPDEASPFYPPRARWFSGFYHLGGWFRRRLALDRLKMPGKMLVGELGAGFLVPGLAVYLRGPRLWGQAALAACAALMLVYLVWLGYPAANLAFGLLISIHATGFVFYCHPLMADASFRSRLAFTFLVLLALMLAIYMPARNLVQEHLVSPLRLGGQVIVVRRFLPPHAFQRGDWMAYSLDETSAGEAHHGGAVWFHGGAGLGPVLAVAGDYVGFSREGYSVNGTLRPSLPLMPVSGGWTVPEKHWFIWPNLAISGHGNVSEESINRTLLRLADVAPEQYLGQPLHHWLWRKQKLP